MKRVTLEVDEWVPQEAAAALDTTSVGKTIQRALAVATEARRGERLARRGARLAPDRNGLVRRNMLSPAGGRSSRWRE